MTDLTPRWRVIALLLCSFGFVAPAGAVDLVGKTTAYFEWSAAAGPVAYYLVEQNLNGRGFEPSLMYISADKRRVGVTGDYGDTVQIRVQAVSMSNETGSYSDLSEIVRFVAPPANGGDLCPNDPDKVAPGVCGCGVSDGDSDGDGAPDCTDLCVDDAGKIAPGRCGCGTSDRDSDGDGTPDCNDACVADAGKIAPGVCGCGTSDRDSDRDGTPDCNDACVADAGKIAPGLCGCGVSERDSDGDGTPDCLDEPEPPEGDRAAPLDFNADGRAELLIRNPATGDIDLGLLGGSSPDWIQADPLDPDMKIVGNGDYDADGYADLLARDPDTGALEIRLLENGRTVAIGDFQLDSDWEVVGSGDYDGDGYVELLLRDPGTRNLQLRPLQGTELLGSVAIARLPWANAEILASGDYNGDGRSDILWQSGYTGFGTRNLYVWYLDDPANPVEEETLSIGRGWEFVGSGDYDGDGTSDALLREDETGNLKVYLFEETEVTAKTVTDESGSFESRFRRYYTVVGSADYDGDGYCDIALRGWYGSLLVLHMEGDRARAASSVEGALESWSADGVGLESPANR